ncbi:MAG: CbtA family protein [Mycobacteriaceae bacterium]
MTRTLLIRGMLAGTVAGVLAFCVAQLIGEGPLSSGIDFEEASEHAAGVHEHGPALVSRTVQSTAGLATGTIVFAIAVGGLFGLAYAFAQGRLGTLSARGTAAVVAGCGFLAVYLIPSLKYPANPPGTTDSDTIGGRTQWYFVMLLVSVVVVIGATVVARQLSERFGSWNACLLAILGGAVVLLIASWLLPVINETPAGFRADELWSFRIASAAIQLTVWATLGLVFGALTERNLRGPSTQRARQEMPVAV